MKNVLKRYILVFVITCFATVVGAGQTSPNQSQSDTAKLKLYLDCDDCDFAYFRRNLPYVDFVRDQNLSDLHIFVTEQRTASNGRSYGLNFLGSGDYSDINYKLTAITQQSDTDLETWNQLLITSKMGLMPFLSRTAESSKIDFQYSSDLEEAPGSQENYDKWNYWVFRTSLGGQLDFEESQSDISSRGSFRIDRITEKLKLRADVMYYRSVETFQDNDATIESIREEIDSDIELVFSLNPRWSLGFFNELRSSTYQNTDLSHRFGPGIEYNIFPWDKSDRRVFSFGYNVYTHYFNYQELTIFDESEEFRTSEALEIELKLKQPWGEVEAQLEGSHYFHDFKKNRLTLETRISVNITKGLSIFAKLDAGIIHDQLNLPAGEITLEELLLKQRQLESAYQFSAEFGLSFTFGSIYNNIVNDRF